MSIDTSKLDQRLLESNVTTLEEGATLIRLLEGDQYVQAFRPAFQSTIGAHFRHVLEHYRCFMSQKPNAEFCYDERERDQLLECDSAYALRTINEILDGFKKITDGEAAADYLIRDEQTSVLVSTSLNRELLFLQSHTVHHYAIIGAMTRAFGNQPEADFGVAIATRVHNEKCADANKAITKGAPCAQ